MRGCLIFVWIAATVVLAAAQQPAAAPKPGESRQSSGASADSSHADSTHDDSNLKEMFEAKIKAEWEAIKNKDKKAYGELLAEDYQGVEVDSRGERTKTQAINELANGNISSYTLWGYKFIPLCSDAAFVIYEVTQQFPPKSVLRFSRVYITELWVKRAGQWKELHYQETHVK
jgi:Domain of unknown function (DUF4440)